MVFQQREWPHLERDAIINHVKMLFVLVTLIAVAWHGIFHAVDITLKLEMKWKITILSINVLRSFYAVNLKVRSQTLPSVVQRNPFQLQPRKTLLINAMLENPIVVKPWSPHHSFRLMTVPVGNGGLRLQMEFQQREWLHLPKDVITNLVKMQYANVTRIAATRLGIFHAVDTT